MDMHTFTLSLISHDKLPELAEQSAMEGALCEESELKKKLRFIGHTIVASFLMLIKNLRRRKPWSTKEAVSYGKTELFVGLKLYNVIWPVKK